MLKPNTIQILKRLKSHNMTNTTCNGTLRKISKFPGIHEYKCQKCGAKRISGNPYLDGVICKMEMCKGPNCKV